MLIWSNIYTYRESPSMAAIEVNRYEWRVWIWMQRFLYNINNIGMDPTPMNWAYFSLASLKTETTQWLTSILTSLLQKYLKSNFFCQMGTQNLDALEITVPIKHQWLLFVPHKLRYSLSCKFFLFPYRTYSRRRFFCQIFHVVFPRPSSYVSRQPLIFDMWGHH